ncbi:molecular chaperone HtpG [Geotoga petraea]|jgi:molecular chaperone HtpG|uniref:Chaperone protein HtpG n=1 Tax=Geotoga petraea TaxID=28234 RepID=A0A1G6KMV8_9BACT|nr:molecular chaperone HtpG [Geotoga petraea]MDK2946452.1 molecular chaperone HtpG [Geotoga sp.]SDC32442.1 molecular chaperone HtpG [Geotoga petraea]
MPEKKQFQTETKQLLNLMINSIYTHKEIFLRELISNASDAIDKMKFESLKDPEILENDTVFKIFIDADEKNKKIIIEDNGIGMSYDDVVENLGTIAKSGTKAFMEQLKNEKSDQETLEMIGQFGVGFYSAFMVADKVTVETKKWNEDNGVKWESDGSGEYEIEYIEKKNRGTKITLHLRKDLEDEDNFAKKEKLEELVRKYSNYIRYPIKMEVTETDEDGKEQKEIKTINSMESLWRKNKDDIAEEEYSEFYKETYHDWTDPFDVIHFKAEGSTVEFTSLLFIPARAPFDYYTKEYKRGLSLYSKNVFIMDKYEELIPSYFSFVKGLVDSPDFTLNISREILQHSKNIKVMKKNIEKKIHQALKSKINNDREKYQEFWNEFGRGMKAGLYENVDKKDKVMDLLLFETSNSEKPITLDEYIENMKKDQEAYIYYAVGESRDSIDNLPQMEAVKEKGFDVLYLTDHIDEFLIQMLHDYKGKQFKSISSSDLKLKDTEEKKKEEEENKDLLGKIKELLSGKVKEVRLTDKLKKSPVCIVSAHEGMSINMEKVLKELDQMPFNAEKILELNPDHQVFKKVKNIYDENPESDLLKDYADILYNQALLMEGMKIENPSDFVEKINKLMS